MTTALRQLRSWRHAGRSKLQALAVVILGGTLLGYASVSYGERLLVLMPAALLLLTPAYYLGMLVLGLLQLAPDLSWLNVASFGGADLYWFDLAVVLVVAKLVIERLFVGKTNSRLPLIYLPLFFLVWWGLMSQLNALRLFQADYFVASTSAFARTLSQLALVVVFAEITTERKRVYFLVDLLLFLVTAQALFAIAQVVLIPHLEFGPDLLLLLTSTKFARKLGLESFWAVGFIGSSKMLAGALILFIFFWLVRATRPGISRTRAGVYLGAASTSLLALNFTQARAGIVAFMAGFVVFLFMSRRRTLAPVLGWLLLCLLLSLPLWMGRFSEEFFSVDDPGLGMTSSEIRLDLLGDAVRSAFQHPLLGVGTSGFSLSSVAEGGAFPHSQYADVLVGMGFIGLGLFLCILLVGLLQAGRLWRVGTDTKARELGLALVPGLVATYVYLSTTEILPAGLGMFWAVLGLCAAALRLEGRPGTAEGSGDGH